MRYKWLMFDADGTLFDYDKAEATALRRTFREVGCRYDPAFHGAYRQINAELWLEFERGGISQGRLRIERFERLFKAFDIGCDTQTFSACYLRNLAKGADLVDGAEEVIKALAKKVGLLLITNGLAEVQRPRFARSALQTYFADVVISEEVGAAKPRQEIFDVAFQRMGSPAKNEVLIVGDSLTSDMKGGSDYGIDTCWFNPAQRSHDGATPIRYEIRNLAEVLSLVGAS
jgi:2-haloacid dehalogenase